jgi:hypothetical protein
MNSTQKTSAKKVSKTDRQVRGGEEVYCEKSIISEFSMTLTCDTSCSSSEQTAFVLVHGYEKGFFSAVGA